MERVSIPPCRVSILAVTALWSYVRHRPERTLLYQLVQEYYPAFKAHLAEQGRALPGYVEQEFEDYLKCGRLEEGFLRVRCETCHAEHLVAFSCRRRGFCPSCGARRMAESAALLVDEVFPEQPVRQWVLSVPYLLRFLFALPSVRVPTGGTGHSIAGVCSAGVRGLPQMRRSGARFPTGTLR